MIIGLAVWGHSLTTVIPDLTPLDFFLYGHLKSLIYETSVATEEEVAARIIAV
jgi:hypothetical protein